MVTADSRSISPVGLGRPFLRSYQELVIYLDEELRSHVYLRFLRACAIRPSVLAASPNALTMNLLSTCHQRLRARIIPASRFASPI